MTLTKQEIHDHHWAEFNKELEEAFAEKQFYSVGTVYYEMASFVESEGTDGTYLRDKGYKYKKMHQDSELKRYDSAGVVKAVEIGVNKGACPACAAHNGEYAMILPIKECTGEYGCRCTYLPVVG